MDGATSDARCESTGLETRPLAEERKSHHADYDHRTAHVPRPPSKRPKRPTGQPNSPRRRGKPKSSARRVESVGSDPTREAGGETDEHDELEATAAARLLSGYLVGSPAR